jgi:hypothetical protein
MADESKTERATDRLTARIGKLEKMMTDFLAAQGYKPSEPAAGSPAQTTTSHAGHGESHGRPGLSTEMEQMLTLGRELVRVLEQIRDRLDRL